MQDNLTRQMANGFNQALAAEQGIVQRRVEQKEEEKAATEELADTFSEAKSAMTQLADLCSQIEESGRIHFQLTRPLAGGAPSVVIAASVSP